MAPSRPSHVHQTLHRRSPKQQLVHDAAAEEHSQHSGQAASAAEGGRRSGPAHQAACACAGRVQLSGSTQRQHRSSRPAPVRTGTSRRHAQQAGGHLEAAASSRWCSPSMITSYTAARSTADTVRFQRRFQKSATAAAARRRRFEFSSSPHNEVRLQCSQAHQAALRAPTLPADSIQWAAQRSAACTENPIIAHATQRTHHRSRDTEV